MRKNHRGLTNDDKRKFPRRTLRVGFSLSGEESPEDLHLQHVQSAALGSSSVWRRLLLSRTEGSRGQPQRRPAQHGHVCPRCCLAPPPARPADQHSGLEARSPTPPRRSGDTGRWRLPSRARTRPEVSEPFLILSTTERKFRKAAARRRDTPASRHRALNAQARRPLSFLLFLLPVCRRQRLLGPMSRRALRRLRGEQRGQEPLGPSALQFVLHDDDDVEEECPKRGPDGRRPQGAGKEGVRVNNRFELVRRGYLGWGQQVGAVCEAGP